MNNEIVVIQLALDMNFKMVLLLYFFRHHFCKTAIKK